MQYTKGYAKQRQSAISLDLTPGKRINQRQRATPVNDLAETEVEDKTPSQVYYINLRRGIRSECGEAVGRIRRFFRRRRHLDNTRRQRI